MSHPVNPSFRVAAPARAQIHPTHRQGIVIEAVKDDIYFRQKLTHDSWMRRLGIRKTAFRVK